MSPPTNLVSDQTCLQTNQGPWRVIVLISLYYLSSIHRTSWTLLFHLKKKKNRSNFSQIFLRWIDIHAVIALRRIWEESHTHSTRLDLDKSMASGFPQDHWWGWFTQWQHMQLHTIYVQSRAGIPIGHQSEYGQLEKTANFKCGQKSYS